MSDFDQLRAFVAVAEERSFTAAARRLGVAQPALSRQVRLLEQRLGKPLLIRTTHSVEPTELGRSLLDAGTEVVRAFDHLWGRIQYEANAFQGRVTIAHTVSVAYETLPGLVDALLGVRPPIEVQTTMLGPADVLDLVRRDQRVIGIVRGEHDEFAADGLALEVLRAERRGVLVPLSHPFAEREAIDFDDLRGERILMHRRELTPLSHDRLIERCRAVGFEADIVFRSVEFDPAFSPVRSGRAITIAAESVLVGALAGLAWVPFREDFISEVWLATRTDAAGTIVDFVRELAIEFAETRSWLDTGPLVT